MAITEASQVKNALSAFPYEVTFAGIRTFGIIKFQLPDEETEFEEHGGAGINPRPKEAGGVTVGDCTMETIIYADALEYDQLFQWNRANRTRDASKYYKDGLVTLKGPNDDPAIQWQLKECACKKLEHEELDSEDKKKKFKLKITLSVNDYDRV